MGQLKRDCPHCNTKNTAFYAFGEYQEPNRALFTVGFRCGGCNEGICARIHLSAGNTPVQHSGDLDDNPNLKILSWYPQPQGIKPPENLPDNLKSFYLQAVRSFKTKDFDASAIMSRKTLEVAIKSIAPELEGTLFDRIEALDVKQLITPDLKTWAHEIRSDGNVATHEEEPVSETFADELLAFTEMFLLYTFTMPGMIKARRKEAKEV